jgi:hypothetical protein
VCPRCGQPAPLIYRGVNAYCTACGAPRVPLTGSALKLAGQPSKVGGTITRVLGWLVLIGGLLTAATLVGLFALLEAPATAMAVVGGSIAAVTALVAYLLLRGGKQLQKSGDDEERHTKNQAIFALANTRGGLLRAWDVAQALQVTAEEGDDLLTRLAKQSPDEVSVEVDDEGTVLYKFAGASAGWRAAPAIAPNAAPPVRRRVEAPPPAPYGGVRVDARDPLEPDAEPAPETRQRAR